MLYILLLIIPLAIYAALSVALMFHLKRYNIDQRSTKKISALFISVSLILAFFTTVAFFSVPWNSLNLNETIGNFIPSSSSNLNQLTN